MSLPPGYVTEHVTLGYASTVHAAQGLNVHTAHTVITPATPLASLYPAMTRGQDANTAHVATRTIPADAPAGAVHDAAHKNPLAVLADAMEAAEPDRSALAVAVAAADRARSVRTAAELFADAAELATAGRTARWLDQLTATGHLTPDQRLTLAAEDGAVTLTRVLRQAELAGHDPHQVLQAAIASRPLDGARQITNVLYKRITESVSLDPVGDTFADWIPRVEDADQRAYLTALAAAADARRTRLGEQVADRLPQWAIEALGPLPADETERESWELRAGSVRRVRRSPRSIRSGLCMPGRSSSSSADTSASSVQQSTGAAATWSWLARSPKPLWRSWPADGRLFEIILTATYVFERSRLTC